MAPQNIKRLELKKPISNSLKKRLQITHQHGMLIRLADATGLSVPTLRTVRDTGKARPSIVTKIDTGLSQLAD